MRVPRDEWIAMKIPSKLNTFKVWGFVRANYCDAMTAKGICPKRCQSCEPALKETIMKLNRPGIKKPVGLLIFLLRELVAKKQEEAHPEDPVERDRYDPQVDPFDEFLDKL